MHAFFPGKRGANRKRLGPIALLVVTILFAFAGSAFAQTATTTTPEEQKDLDGVNLELFRPSIFGGNFIAIEDAHTLTRWSPGIAVVGDYANSVWSKYDENDEFEYDFISEMSTAHLMAAFGTFSWLSLGVDVPLHYSRKRTFTDIRTGEGVSPELESWREVGDVRVEMKIAPLREDKHWIGVALAPYVIIPTDVEEHLLGENRVTGGGTLALEHDFGPINIGLNGGYQVRGRNEFYGTEIGDAVKYGAGIGNKYDFGLFWSIEGWGSVFDVEDTDLVRNVPAEWTARIGYQFGKRGPSLFAGGGTGVSSGIGAPQYRVIGGLAYYYVREDLATVRVRVIDENGQAIAASLNINGPSGALAQVAQAGEYTMEDAKPGSYTFKATAEGYQEATKSQAIKKAETVEIVLQLAPVPKPDTTAFVSVVDKCAKKPVDATVKLSDGTTITAGSKQKIAPGTYTVEVSADDYQVSTQSITIEAHTDNKIEIAMVKKIKALGSVYFAVNSDKILPKSFPVLDDVADQIQSLCGFEKVVIEGHTDADGSDERNLDLSQRRAASVRAYLANKGIDATKLEPIGYGESKPIADNTTADGKAQNRRVEFIVK